MEDYFLQNLDLRDIVKLNLRFLMVFGYFPPDCQETLPKTLYNIYSVIFVGFIFVLFILSEVINMGLVFGDMEKMTRASFLLLTHIVQTLKLSVFVINKSKVRKLINSLNRQEFKPKNQTQYLLLKEDIKISRRITIVFLLMCVATCVAWGFFPLLDKKDGESIKLPLSGWFPFNTEKPPIFEYVYMYLTLGSMINGLANISMDTFLSGIIMVISGQLKLLNNEFETLRMNYKVPDPNELMHKELYKNIIHHRSIIQFSSDMTNLFTTYMTGQFIVSVIIICLTMFQMSLVSVWSLQFLSMGLYQGCMVLEIFLWCYFGNEVIFQSEKLTRSAYTSQWTDATKKVKRNLLYFMMRSQVPLKLYAGGYFTLSLDTFTSVVKSSWSYFAVLNRVHLKQS